MFFDSFFGLTHRFKILILSGVSEALTIPRWFSICFKKDLGAGDENIARITWDSEKRQITNIVFFEEGLRFKCKRCAVLCCKLGGPKVSEKDVERLKEAGYKDMDFLDTAIDKEVKPRSIKEGVLKQKMDGSCIFLQYDGRNKLYKCGVYDLRPASCRLYPFEFEVLEPKTVMLKFIPCCNGLNTHSGALVDKKFIEEHLLESILKSL